jgi:hypothetical protein
MQPEVHQGRVDFERLNTAGVFVDCISGNSLMIDATQVDTLAAIEALVRLKFRNLGAGGGGRRRSRVRE